MVQARQTSLSNSVPTGTAQRQASSAARVLDLTTPELAGRALLARPRKPARRSEFPVSRLVARLERDTHQFSAARWTRGRARSAGNRPGEWLCSRRPDRGALGLAAQAGVG